MSLIFNSGIGPRNELANTSLVTNWFISVSNSSPMIGQVDDSIIGTFELTRSRTKLDKYHACLLFQNCTVYPDITEKMLTGRDIISKLLETTPVNFTRKPKFYNPDHAWINYDPSEIKVVIERGKLISGVLDAASIKKGSNGGLYHVIYSDYGPEKAIESIFNTQQVALAYLRMYGNSIGPKDLMLSLEAQKRIQEIESNIISESLQITKELNAGEIIPPIGKTIDEFYEQRQISALSVLDDFLEPIFRSINFSTNNLFKLIASGSKGDFNGMANMVSAIGQKLINGERIRQTFSYKRTLSNYRRFDPLPESRGYIGNSYIVGMTATEYIFNAMNARFDIITKALSTAATGEQNRKSIKNLESIIINNYRLAIKNENIIQFVYGENNLDTRFLERSKFPTVSISDEEFAAKYDGRTLFKDAPAAVGKLLESEFKVLEEDRNFYRSVFLNFEHLNVKELFSDEKVTCANIPKLVDDVLIEFPELLSGKDSLTPTEIAQSIETVYTWCENFVYVLLNKTAEKKRAYVPDYLKGSVRLVQILVRSMLCSRNLYSKGINKKVVDIILTKIREKYMRAVIEYGTAAGVIAAQAFSEPLTQYMLDAHHRSATGGTSTAVITIAKEVLGVKPTEKLINPQMLITLTSDVSSNKERVQEIANNIEVMKLSLFAFSYQIFFEKYGEPIHPEYKHEVAIIKEFSKLNPLLSVPGDLVRWCIRIVLNKTTLILKNMSIEMIINRLRENFPNIYIVYTPENAPDAILRIYMRSEMFKGHVDVAQVEAKLDMFKDTIIRGINGINSTTVVKMIRSKINENGAIVRDENNWGIRTAGTNMYGVLANKFVDKRKIQTTAIMETYLMFGIEAARQRIISQLRDLVEGCNQSHRTVYADEMTYTGRPTSIERSGLNTREASNVLLRIGFSSPMQTIEEASINAMEDTVTGITGKLLVGSGPKHGTIYNSFYVDEEFVAKNRKSAQSYLEAL